MRSRSAVSFAWVTSASIAARSEAQRFASSAFDIHCEIALLKSPRRKKAGNIDREKGVIVPLAGCRAFYRITPWDPDGFQIARADLPGLRISSAAVDPAAGVHIQQVSPLQPPQPPQPPQPTQPPKKKRPRQPP